MAQTPDPDVGRGTMNRTRWRQRLEWRGDGRNVVGRSGRTGVVGRFHDDLSAFERRRALAEERGDTFAAVDRERRRGDGPGFEFHL